MTTMQEEARLALAAKGAAEKDIARLSLCPPWRHAVFAGMVAALVAAPAVPLPWRFGLLALLFVAMALVVRSDRRRLGVFINGYRRGRTRRVTFPMLAVILLLYGASFYLGDVGHRPQASLLLAVLAFAVGYVGSTIWQRVFVRELGA